MPITVELDAALERTLATLGTLEPQVLSRGAPGLSSEGKPVPWPTEMLGKLRIVRRPDGGILLVTHGLSYPLDESMHGAGSSPLHYELGVEVAGSEPIGVKTVASSSNAELANAWLVHVLWFLAGCYLEERVDLLGLFTAFPLVSGIVPALPGLEQLVTPEGYVGILQGIPRSTTTPYGSESQLPLARVGEYESRLVMVTLLTAAELAYVRSVTDSSRAVQVVQKLPSRHVSSAVRASVVA